MSSRLVSLKTRRVEEPMNIILVGAQTSFCWCRVEGRRGGCQLKCHPRHLTIVQNDELLQDNHLDPELPWFLTVEGVWHSIIKQYSVGIEYVASAINGFKINNLEGCPLDVHHLLADHEKCLQMAVNLETILQINSNCVIFGDFNATHNTWNCSRNSTRGIQLKNFSDIINLEIAFPNSPTRYGYNSYNTLDFALISNFNFPYNIESISELSSDHNPVMLNFSLSYSIHKDNSRAITTCWSAFKKNIKNNMHQSDFTKINNPPSLEEKIRKFTDVVCSAHQLSSNPITNKTHSYTPQHIKELITRKNSARKLFQQTLNPIHKIEANRLQALVKRELKIHSQNTWNAKLNALGTRDNSLWHTQKHFRKKTLKHSKFKLLFRHC
ncbi:hypothetical protein TNCV_2617221 [Trichonephila clavipes]|nr:hypothetical protein TNCV_2617221 [Trichonephila clavipes]